MWSRTRLTASGDSPAVAFFQPSAHDTYWPGDSDIDLPGSPTVYTLGGQQVVAFGSKNGSFINALIQYNTDNHQWSSNARLNLIHRPLSDFFFVYNERRLETSGDLIDRSVIAKLTWLMMF